MFRLDGAALRASLSTYMLAPRVIVFDLDGTLLDTSPDIAASCNFAL